MEQQTVNQTRVKILGEDHIIAGNESSEYMTLIGEYVDRKMREFQKGRPYLSHYKIAVLTALNLADELTKLQNDYDELLQQMEEKETGNDRKE